MDLANSRHPLPPFRVPTQPIQPGSRAGESVVTWSPSVRTQRELGRRWIGFARGSSRCSEPALGLVFTLSQSTRLPSRAAPSPTSYHLPCLTALTPILNQYAELCILV